MSNDDIEFNNHISNVDSLLRSAERIIPSTQASLSTETSTQEEEIDGLPSAPYSSDAMIFPFKRLAVHQAIRHPIAYARILIQVKCISKPMTENFARDMISLDRI